MTAICRSGDLTVPPLVGCCLCNLEQPAPKTDNDVQCVLGSSSKPMNADVNASPEHVSVMADVIYDDLHLWPEKNI